VVFLFAGCITKWELGEFRQFCLIFFKLLRFLFYDIHKNSSGAKLVESHAEDDSGSVSVSVVG